MRVEGDYIGKRRGEYVRTECLGETAKVEDVQNKATQNPTIL